ncbi:MAG: FAD-dependent oxidoreductase [Gammaproteobacteria bacterium]|nr:FAD-dependent oxidoreductase [Gammaproteobacteria bacterium]MDH3371866.1 FAD-dependent oxidoreductase [Gammaproteobacteria bacterium]MDH3407805.1 FAD-dependent oxidoreductase [Gammaproteobacteria bacterium]MDH3551152.1 FAD-dependent oxidoreductase [Gammaproteobacteria bacterium]
MKYQNLLAPGTIGKLQLRNRIILAAMGTMYADEDGTCTERLNDYYEARAKGGAGMLIVETSTVSWPHGASMPRMLGFSEDRFIPGLKTLVERVHKHGATIAAQLNHSGKHAADDVAHGRPVYVPSIPKPATGDLFQALTQAEMASFISSAGPDGKGPRFHELTKQDISEVIQRFADAAKRCLAAGFDAIQIHGGHGYLISSFLSPYTNRRDDEYGGSIENRARLLTEIVAAVRAAVGAEFPILLRLDANEYRIDGGITIDLAVETAKLAERAGIDAIDVSAYGNGLSGIAFTEAPLVHKPGGLLDFAHRIKAAVNVPVIGVGRVEPELAEREIGSGKIDFLAIGRKLLADPDLPRKLAAGDEASIRPCIFCYVCVSKIFMSSPIVCAVNPATGREQALADNVRAPTPKRISVVGGGPAGLEAARVLALRGHTVTLHDNQRDLGGTARIASLPYAENAKLVDWLVESVRRLPIDVRLGSDATVESLVADKPDHVVVATGAVRSAPDIPGKHHDHVFDGDRLRGVLFGEGGDASRGLSLLQRFLVWSAGVLGITRNIELLRRMSKFYMPLGKRVVLIGGGLVGLELAEYLVERGRTVTVLEESPNLGAELAIVRRARVLHMLREDGVTMVKSAKIVDITADEVVYSADGETRSVAADNVIISTGARGDSSLVDELTAAGLPTSAIGDCVDVGYIEGAMLSARSLAVEL